MFIDTHCHLNFHDFKDDADEIIRKNLVQKIWMILVGTDTQTSRRAIELANKYENGVFATVGLHPLHLKSERIQSDDYSFTPRYEQYSRDTYERLSNFEKVVAIGEIGLDYFHFKPNDDIQPLKDQQSHAFTSQIILARQINLPAIIHCRAAHTEMIAEIKKLRSEHKNLFRTNSPWGVVHCFTGTEDQAWEYFKLGLLISFTGIITFTDEWDDLLKKIPSDKFLIETDAPYLSPAPFRGKRNEPEMIKYTANKIALLKNLTLTRVAEITSFNAKKLFKL